MRNLTILVSPHPDDIALSIGAMVPGNRLPRPLVNISLFTRNINATYGYRGLSQFIPRRFSATARFRKMLSMLEITRLRKREDLKFFKSQGIPYIDLNLLDAPLRAHRDPTAASQFTTTDHLALEDIRSRISKLTSTLESGYMLIPLGIGNHIDHRIAREACLRACGKLCPVFYEDLPYAADVSLEEIAKFVESLDSSLHPAFFEIGNYMQTKIANLRLYSSEIGRPEIDRTVLHAQRLGENSGACERVWLSGEHKIDGSLKSN